MICQNCQKEIKDNARFCVHCGIKIPDESVNHSNGIKDILVNLFNLRVKKNLLESIVLYVFSVGTILPVYFVVPTSQDSETYILNAFITAIFLLIISLFRQNKYWYLWALAGGILGYLLGTIGGLLSLIPLLMTREDSEPIILGKVEKDYIYSFYKNGIILYLLGITATVISYAASQKGETYTIWYGAVVWGLVKIFQGIYYQSKPELITKKINDYLQKNNSYPKQNSIFGISPGFKKFLVYFSILIVIIIIIGVLANL